MVEDTKMEDTTTTKAASKDEDKNEPKNETSKTTSLEAAARRLERLLGGGSADQQSQMYTYGNPVKVTRRWLGTASGASGKATSASILAASTALLDPSHGDDRTRSLLLAIDTEKEAPAATGASSMDVESDEKPSSKGTTDYLSMASRREVESWLLSLQVRILWKEEKYTEAMALVEQGIAILLEQVTVAAKKVTSTAGRLVSSLFPLLARLYRYRSLVADSIKDSSIAIRLRQVMAKAHNMACLRRDVDSQATLLNLMLRDLLLHSQVEQANKLLSNATFPDSASNNELCRYLYYSGRIQALRLEYTTAFSNLSQCLRKAPTNTGLGFRLSVQRLLLVVQLLMGEIPKRHVFFTKGMKTELAPYLAITQAVRRGDLAVYTKVVSEQSSQIQLDDTYTLISRLAQQVVKAGLRKLHISYSRLSLQDVADRLGLPSATSAEFVVAKAVRDGVLDATIHHEEGYVQSHDLVDVYATKEPAEAFHRRIAYCLTTHNDAVRGMRYPPDEYKKQIEASRGNRRGKRGSDDKTDEEKAQELEEEFDEDY
jgi:26S proteasome regulatory subunit N3